MTTDDLAAEVGISKATLYKLFASKEEILREAVLGFMNRVLAGVEALIQDQGMSFIEKLASLFSFLGKRLSQFGPLLIRDIQKSAPFLWKEIEEIRTEKILKNFKIILEAGRNEGVFREDLDLDLLVQMFLILIQEFLNPEALLSSGRIPSDAFGPVVTVFFQGILTDKARQEFSENGPDSFRPTNRFDTPG